jgi:hypothetical protein
LSPPPPPIPSAFKNKAMHRALACKTNHLASLQTIPLSSNTSHGRKMNAPPWPRMTPLLHTVGPLITTTQPAPRLQQHICFIRKVAMQAMPCQPRYVG